MIRGTVPVGIPARRGAGGGTEREGCGRGFGIGIEPVALGNWRDADDDMEVVFHHAPGEQLDSAEVGYIVHPVDDAVFQSVVFEEHRFVGDAGS